MRQREPVIAALFLIPAFLALAVFLYYPIVQTGLYSLFELNYTTDLARGLVERTRGDLTTSLQQESLRAALDSVEQKLDSRPKEGGA